MSAALHVLTDDIADDLALLVADVVRGAERLLKRHADFHAWLETHPQANADPHYGGQA